MSAEDYARLVEQVRRERAREREQLKPRNLRVRLHARAEAVAEATARYSAARWRQADEDQVHG